MYKFANLKKLVPSYFRVLEISLRERRFLLKVRDIHISLRALNM